MNKLRVLALNPFHGGSHKAFLEQWIQRSHHDWQLLTLAGSYWKWRLQFAAVELAEKVNALWQAGERWDVIFTTSMMNVAEFRAFTPSLQSIPLITYFHENQLTYPASNHMKFVLSLSMVNIKSALSSDRVWFNSDFHRHDFLQAAQLLLKPKPSVPTHILDQITAKSEVQYPAIEDDFQYTAVKTISDPVKLVWAARWELEKNPQLLFKALRRLKESGRGFELYFLGEEMHTSLECIEEGKLEFQNEIKSFGYAETKSEYISILKSADIFISTAEHEFFGIAAVEASLAGCRIILPSHQAYPEVFAGFENIFYKPGSAKQLADKISELIDSDTKPPFEKMAKYLWSHRVAQLDAALYI